jgi:hypothetical protein
MPTEHLLIVEDDEERREYPHHPIIQSLIGKRFI